MTESLTDQTAGLATAPEPVSGDERGVPLGRRVWRQLTSMRTALQLLFLLAVAAVPGSLLPQRGNDDGRVTQFLQHHPTLGPLMDRLFLFDVFASPWFAAIYLLLFVSLIGCLTPRIRLHARALRKPPPRAPRHFARLPQSASWDADASPAEVVSAVRRQLRARRWRVVERDGALCAEAGYLRETGNLLFHVALVLLLAAVAWGGLWGYKGDVLLINGEGFSNTPLAYDSLHKGRLWSASEMTPFSFTLDEFKASYQPNGQAKSFDGFISWRPKPGASVRKDDVRENHPLVVADNALTGGLKVYLAGHGYAPKFVVREPDGKVVFDDAVAFLPVDANTYQSDGVVKVPYANPQQLAFQGFFTPTTVFTPNGVQSSFPGPRKPAVTLTAYHGRLVDTGSVYTLDTSQMKQYAAGGRVAARTLTPGQTWKLPDGSSITFTGFTQFADFHLNYDPGKRLALVAACAIVLGLLLSLRVRRRRLWVRAVPSDDGPRRTVVEVGGLARTDPERFADEFARLVERLRARVPPRDRESARESQEE